MTKEKDYSKLFKTYDYDREKAELLSEAMTERYELLKRVKYLEDLAKENKGLAKFLWTTAEGKVIALHKLEDDHLRNILKHIVDRNGVISPALKAEARSRNIEIPAESDMAAAVRYLNAGRQIESEIVDEDWRDSQD